MFRDPAYFRSLRRAGRARAAHLSVAQDLGGGLQHRRGGVLARHPAARGGAAGPDVDLRDRHQPAARCRRPRPASTTSIALPGSPRTTVGPAQRSSLSDYYTAAYGRAVLDKSLRSNIVFSDHSLATDSVFAEVQLVSCRNVLIYFDRALQDRALGLFRDVAVPQGVSRHRRQGIAALLGARATPSSRWFGKIGSSRSETRREVAGAMRRPRSRRGRHRHVGRRRRGALGAAARAARATAACRFSSSCICHARAPEPARRSIFSPQMRRAGSGGGGQGPGARRERYTSRRPTITCCVDVGPHAGAVGGRAVTLFTAVH